MKKAISLIELVMALALIAGLTLTATSAAIFLQKTKKNVLGQQEILTKGNLTTASVFERVLRAGAASGSGFTITNSGKKVEFSRQTPQGPIFEKIYYDSNTKTIKYETSNIEKILLSNVENLQFSESYGRLITSFSTTDGQKFRIGVVPRNHWTPQAIVD